jgi:adenine-specific DNA-methyltransferase
MSRQRARELRRSPTDAEQALWARLRGRQLCGHKFRRQQPLGPYVVDFACLKQKLVVEVDGGQHVEQAEADAERSRWLRAQGFRVLRFWNHEVLAATDDVLEAILDALERSPLPNPPPQGGRE